MVSPMTSTAARRPARRRVAARFAAAALLAALTGGVLAAAAQPASADTLAPASAQMGVDWNGEASFLSLINQARAQVGVAPLALNAGLSDYARNHAWEMAHSQSLYHSNISVLLGGWSTVGENVGVGGSVGQVHNALMASPGHYANLSSGAFTSVGIGAFIDDNGTTWTVHVFAA